MFTGKKKIERNLDVVKPENRLLRLLRSNDCLHISLPNVEREDQEDAFDGSQKQIQNAMLEAEYQKAKAITATQQSRSFC